MDATVLDGVYEAFQDYHAHFAPFYGRKQWRERGRQSS